MKYSRLQDLLRRKKSSEIIKWVFLVVVVFILLALIF